MVMLIVQQRLLCLLEIDNNKMCGLKFTTKIITPMKY